MAGRQPRLSWGRRSGRCLSFHHERTSTLPLDLLLAQPNLAVPLFHIISFVIHKRHGGLNGGLVLPVRPAARRAILEGVLAGPAASPLGHGLVEAPSRRRSCLRQVCLAVVWPTFCLALWHHHRCEQGSRGSITGRIRLACTLPKLRSTAGGSARGAQRAQGLASIFRAGAGVIHGWDASGRDVWSRGHETVGETAGRRESY